MDLTVKIRDVTDDEVAFYTTNGWVMLRRLVDPDLAVRMREIADERMTPLEGTPWRRADRVALEGVDPFRSFMFSERMGRNAQRLTNRARLAGAEVPVRYHHDMVICRPPQSNGSLYHQDSTEEGSDRPGRLTFWLALDQVTPEMGAMRFLSGVHREGPLGLVIDDGGPHDPDDLSGLLKRYPRLPELYEWSEPFHYEPGDATVHDGYMVHGGPPNTESRARWNYQFGYIPVDTRYINGLPIRPGIVRHQPDEAVSPVVYAR